MTDIVPGNRTLSRQNAWACSPFFSRLLARLTGGETKAHDPEL
jgi:hypothetical protein